MLIERRRQFRTKMADVPLMISERDWECAAPRISAGLTFDIPSGHEGRYRLGAVLPASPWTLVSSWEYAKPCFKGDTNIVGLLKLPGEITINHSALSDIFNKHGDLHLTEPARQLLEPYRQPLLRWVRKFATRLPLLINGFRFHLPGQPTLTVGEDGLLIGLHIDSWDRLPPKCRIDSTNRICLNLGPGSRQFLFLPLPIWEMDTFYTSSTSDANETVRRYISSNMSGQVISITMPSGYAYIAPTEGIIHDASSTGSSSGCVTFTVRGFFEFI